MMAYPYGFNPYGMPMQPPMGYAPQPVPDQLAQLRMQQQQPMTMQQAQPGVIFVDSEEEARAYRVAPNNEVVFINLTAFELYKKRAQSIGEPTTFRVFDISEREEPGPSQAAGTSRRRNQAQQVEYATKAELESAVGMINQLANIVSQMAAPKEATKHDETAV